ncbi:pentapeptide repeat-containing protein [Candidatus Thioglobus sp.]|nr:pentapeptide repeat-containing protein [Candidatus Thioglobus sp.]
MKKITTSLILLLFSYNVSAEIPRDSISNIKQLTWNDIVLQFSETYVFNTATIVDKDGSIVYYPSQEKFGKFGSFLSSGQSYSKQYLYRYFRRFDDYKEGFDGNGSWGVNKANNTICYSGEIETTIDLDNCVYMFEGFENGKKYVYFSLTQNGGFYERINKILKISNETTFNEWSLAALDQESLNIKNVRNYNDKKIERAKTKEVETNILKLNALNSCNNCYLKGVNLSGSNLSEASFYYTDLRDADLSGADLSGSNLRDADLSESDLRDADLSGADLRGSDLRGADLSGADLRKAVFNGETVFTGANLSGANLFGLEQGVYYYGNKILDLSGVNLSGADLRKADLSGGVDIIATNLSGSDLRDASLYGSNLTGADLRGSDLRGTDLSRANLRDADLSGSNLTGADLSLATLCNTKTPWGIDDSGC